MPRRRAAPARSRRPGHRGHACRPACCLGRLGDRGMNVGLIQGPFWAGQAAAKAPHRPWGVVPARPGFRRVAAARTRAAPPRWGLGECPPPARQIDCLSHARSRPAWWWPHGPLLSMSTPTDVHTARTCARTAPLAAAFAPSAPSNPVPPSGRPSCAAGGGAEPPGRPPGRASCPSSGRPERRVAQYTHARAAWVAPTPLLPPRPPTHPR